MTIKNKKDWRDWLVTLLGIKPDDRQELIDLLQRLQRTQNSINENEMNMLEGVLKMSLLRIRDVMIPRTDIVQMKSTDTYKAAIGIVSEWQHSRYPVFDDNDNVQGILLAKDLLGYVDKPDAFVMREVMRTAILEPVSKTLDTMLDEFRQRRNHMVIAIDEHQQVVGIVTIEDVLEQIVGTIEDESDDAADRAVIPLGNGDGYSVKGTMPIETFNSQFDSDLPVGAADSIAGWLAAEIGHMPVVGETLSKHGLNFCVAKADKQRIYTLVIKHTADK